MTETDERYAKILKSLESEGQDFDEFGDNDKDDIDRNFEVPSVKPERKAPAPENWDADILSLKDLQKMRDEDESGVQAQKYASTADTRKSTEDWDDVISMKELIQLQNEDSGKFSGKKFDGNSNLEQSVTDASYTDMLRKKQDLDKDPTMPHAGYTYQDGQEIDLEITEGDGYEEPYGSLLEPAEDEDDNETFGPEAKANEHTALDYFEPPSESGLDEDNASCDICGFKIPWYDTDGMAHHLVSVHNIETTNEAFGSREDENPEFKMKGDKKGVVDMPLEKGINSRKFWDEAITTEDEEVVKVGYNPHPNAELDMPKADFKKKRPADDLEGIESLASEVLVDDMFQKWLTDSQIHPAHGTLQIEDWFEFARDAGFTPEEMERAWNGKVYGESLDIDEDELSPLEDPVKDIPKEDFEDEMYDMLNHDKLNDTQSTDIYGNDDANSMTPASGFTGKMDHDEAEGSMGDIWNCPECGFKTASKPEFDDHSQSHSAIPADTGESFDFEDLGTDDDILSKFRNE